MTNQAGAANGAAQLIYLMDPHCGWCFGFAGTIKEIAAHYAQDPRLQVSLVTGGLFHPAVATTPAFADEKRPIAERVAKMFDVRFAEAYFQNVLASGHLDSLVPCQFINAVKALQPSATFEFAHRLMQAAFTEGRDISQAGACLDIARGQGLDSEAVEAAVASPEVNALTMDSFALARRLGTGFPSLFLRRGEALSHLGGANLTLDSLKLSLDARLHEAK